MGVGASIRRWSRRVLGALAAAIVLGVLVGAAYQFLATRRDARRFPPPGRLFEVEGRALHARIRGGGAPTVVFDAPLGLSSLSWELVAPKASERTTTLVFDRPGYGWSEAGPRPRDSARIVSEMHELLRATGVPKPYVLVGASFGGCDARLYAFRHPGDVAGLVLVDPAHEDMFARMPSSARPSLTDLRLYQLGAHLGILRLAGLPVGIAGMNVLPSALQRSADAVGYRADAVDAIVDETAALDRSFDEVRRARIAAGRLPLGDKPLVVLTHRSAEPEPDAKAYEAWVELHAELAKESSRGTQVLVERSGHFIAVDQPARVVDAIREVVEAVRSDSAPRDPLTSGASPGTPRSPSATPPPPGSPSD